MKQLTRQHHKLKEGKNAYSNRLQQSIDLTFPEFNQLFKSMYGTICIARLKAIVSADKIAKTTIRTLSKCFHIKDKGKQMSLTAEKLKEVAKSSIDFSSIDKAMNIKSLIVKIELINEQIDEIDKKIEEFSLENNSLILTIPGISHFSVTSILTKLGEMGNYDKASKVIKWRMLLLKNTNTVNIRLNIWRLQRRVPI